MRVQRQPRRPFRCRFLAPRYRARRVEPPAEDRALVDPLAGEPPDFQPVARRPFVIAGRRFVHCGRLIERRKRERRGQDHGDRDNGRELGRSAAAPNRATPPRGRRRQAPAFAVVPTSITSVSTIAPAISAARTGRRRSIKNAVSGSSNSANAFSTWLSAGAMDIRWRRPLVSQPCVKNCTTVRTIAIARPAPSQHSSRRGAAMASADAARPSAAAKRPASRAVISRLRIGSTAHRDETNPHPTRAPSNHAGASNWRQSAAPAVTASTTPSGRRSPPAPPHPAAPARGSEAAKRRRNRGRIPASGAVFVLGSEGPALRLAR